MNHQKRLTLLSRELAKIDADFRSNFDYSRDATELEIDAQLSRKDHVYARRAKILLEKLNYEVVDEAPEVVPASRQGVISKVAGAFKTAPVPHKVDFDGSTTRS